MKRDPSQLTADTFDVVVIGGGIYGAWTALDAATRGLRVAVIDKADWASGTSSASTKLIHGGLRYLEHMQFGLVRHSLRERAVLQRVAPQHVSPLRFLIPLYDDNRVKPWKLRMGIRLYDMLAGSQPPIPRAGSQSRDEVIGAYDFLRKKGLQGALTYGDGQTDDARLVIDIVATAVQAGAVANNYVAAERLVYENGRADHLITRDVLTGDEKQVRAKSFVWATGAWTPGIYPSSLRDAPVRVTKGIHLVLPALNTRDAFLFTARRDGRVFFVVPWYGRALLGTTDTDYDGRPDDLRVDSADVDYLLREANALLPECNWSASDVLGSFAGLRVMRSAGGSPSSLSRDWRVVRTEENVLVSAGGKYTSARKDAADIVNAVCRLLQRPDLHARTHVSPLVHSHRCADPRWRTAALDRGRALGVDADSLHYCLQRHGDATDNILARIENQPELAERVVPSVPFCRGDLEHCARSEMVVRLEDLVRRRAPLSILERLDDAHYRSLAAVVAKYSDWDETRLQKEVERCLNAQSVSP